MGSRKTTTFAAGNWLQVTWERDLEISGTQDIKLSFRIPVEEKTIIPLEGANYPAEKEPDFPKWFENIKSKLQKLFNAKQGVNVMSLFEDEVKLFTKDLEDGIKTAGKESPDSPFAIMTKAFTGFADTQNALAHIKEKAAQAAKKVLFVHFNFRLCA